MVSKKPQATDFFWDLAKSMLFDSDTDEGTLMGFPCLRVDGRFFGMCDHRTGELIVKLSKDRVEMLIDAGVAQPFAPAGRVFKEWVLVSDRDPDQWRTLLVEARSFVKAS